jgi:Flp pilus assembly protein TadB
MPETRKHEPTLGELFHNLTAESRLLLRQEVQLAKAELKQSATRMSRGAGFVSAAGFLGNAALLCLIAAIVAGLATFMALWLAAFIVAIVIGAIAVVVGNKGLSIIKHTEVAPEQTIQTVREDVVWLTKKH